MPLSQDPRLLTISTPLGPDKLFLLRVVGEEHISRLFQFQLELISDDNAIKAKDLVGKNVTFSIERPEGEDPRYFNGFISQFAAGDERDGRRNYRARVVPWFWFLTKTTDCRIFQEESIDKIIKKIFDDLGFDDVEINLSGDHPQRAYCVQYRESDFHFVSRLLEEEGCFYYFKHENGKHTLCIADAASAYEDALDNEVDYPTDFGTYAREDHLKTWEHRFEFRSGKYAQTDFNFETPSNKLMTNSSTVAQYDSNDAFEIYDYPGIYGDTGAGSPLTDIRMEAEEIPHDVAFGTSTCSGFLPGHKFKINQHRNSDEEGKSYVLVSISHEANETMGYETGGAAGGYSNSFECIPAETTFRPPRDTRKPFVQGIQTAIVTGPPGEEIYPDKYGRVKVQFHWDREGQYDDKSSCWVRVSQSHSGKGFGAIQIPRIGEEVIVDFLEGDPDRPIITGRLYHADNMPPYELPAGKVISGMKSKTHKGAGFNEFIMDDTKSKELIRIHAQYDLEATIEHDERRTIVEGTQTVTVKGNTSLTVLAGTRSVSVSGGDYVVTAENAVSLHGQGKGVSITGDAKGVSITGTGKGVNVSGKGGTGVLLSGEPNFEAIGKSKASVTAPDVFIGDKKITISGTLIELKAPGGTITLDASGVTIAGTMIKSAASAVQEISGGLVKIN